MAADERGHVRRALDASQAGIEHQLRYARGGLNFDLQHIRLRRQQHPEIQLLGGHLMEPEPLDRVEFGE